MSWPDIYYKKCINQECILFFCSMHESFCSHKQWLGKLGVGMHSTSPKSSLKTWRTCSCVSPTMLVIVASQSKGSYLGASKRKLFICQSIHGLCKMNQDNPMMIRFFGDEMTLNMTLLECNPMVTSNTLVSWCVIGLKERLWLSMISFPTNVTILYKAKLCCHINSLLTKHPNAVESNNV